jgi:hypothetical protein
MSSPAQYTCPACGFLVFDEPPGSYAICDVCGWEDDHVQLANPAMDGGANRESLIQVQQRTLATYPLAVQVQAGYKRDSGWRPISETDVRSMPPPPRDGKSYFDAATSVESQYYWRSGGNGGEQR